MQVEAIQGYFDNGVFYQQGRMFKLPDRKMVIVNILDIPIDTDTVSKADLEFWKGFDKQVKDSAEDKLSMTNFPRVHSERDFVFFNDEVNG